MALFAGLGRLLLEAEERSSAALSTGRPSTTIVPDSTGTAAGLCRSDTVIDATGIEPRNPVAARYGVAAHGHLAGRGLTPTRPRRDHHR